MKEVSPQVFVLAQTNLDPTGVHDFLRAIGAPVDWTFTNDAALEYPRSQGDMLVELAGRTCYKSFGTELNDNVTRVREDPRAYLDNVKASGHGSVLEHPSMTFAFHNVSRVFTHELVRHRAGTAVSQESLRFVRTSDLSFWVPTELEPVRDKVISMVETMEEMRIELAADLEVDTMSFADKKKVTSAIRRILPDGMGTTIIWTANARALRHTIEMRTHRSAEREIRLVFGEVANTCLRRWPLLFSDYEVEEVDGLLEWTTPFKKV